MGVCDYKGGATHYHSIGQNVMTTLVKYPMRDGYFGFVSPSTGNETRNISSHDNMATAKDFYDRIAHGEKETIYKQGSLRVTNMHDGTTITMRTFSHSDGTPVVEIHINPHVGAATGTNRNENECRKTSRFRV